MLFYLNLGYFIVFLGFVSTTTTNSMSLSKFALLLYYFRYFLYAVFIRKPLSIYLCNPMPNELNMDPINLR
jgi:hypothetical protein